MNHDFEYYLKNIEQLTNDLTDIVKDNVLNFYNKYKNIYKFDDMLNINC